MNAHGLFDASLVKTNLWLSEIAGLLGWEDGHRALGALRATLHALRDRLDVDHAARLGAQLPLIVRGVYYEGWDPSGKPLRVRHVDDFLELVARELAPGQDDLDRIVRAVLRVLCKHVTPGESERIRQVLPRSFRELWPVDLGVNASEGG